MPELVSIENFCGQANPSGLRTIEYVPTTWVNDEAYEELINSTYQISGGLPLASFDWLRLPIIPFGEPWRETQQRSAQGNSFLQSIQAITPRLRHEVSGQLNAMAEYAFLVRLTDRHGQQWLIGTLESPLSFTANSEIGADQGGLNHYSIEFSGQTPQRAYGLPA